MTITVEAIYENGTLKLSQPLPLKDQERVHVTVQTTGPQQMTGMAPCTDSKLIEWAAMDAELEYPPDSEIAEVPEREIVQARMDAVRRSHGLLRWTGSLEDLDYLVNSEENSILEAKNDLEWYEDVRSHEGGPELADDTISGLPHVSGPITRPNLNETQYSQTQPPRDTLPQTRPEP